LKEALAFQSTLARLVRDSGLTATNDQLPATDLTWERWIRIEGDKRTKLIVYCLFNLHSITWDIPPLILNTEVKLNLPDPAAEWKATTADQWKELHIANKAPPIPFQLAFNRLFSKPPQDPGFAVSPLGNYVLVHALIQQIFFARQLSMNWPGSASSMLRSEDITVLERALSAWKQGWKRAPESSLDPQNPNGPVAFTSTALLGLAYIRLHIHMGPVRHLETRDSVQIAHALRNTPNLQRDPRLTPALLHSAHALSIPVRLGIDFVARTQTFFWSIQHSICSLECAFLLSKWLAALARMTTGSGAPLSDHERKLLLWVRSLLEESDPATGNVKPSTNNAAADSKEHNQKDTTQLEPPKVPKPADATKTDDTDGSALLATQAKQATAAQAATEKVKELLDDKDRLKRLSVSVLRTWSKTFKGNTSWAIVDMIGGALEIYADLLEADLAAEGGGAGPS
jgi:hypothetical protein